MVKYEKFSYLNGDLGSFLGIVMVPAELSLGSLKL